MNKSRSFKLLIILSFSLLSLVTTGQQNLQNFISLEVHQDRRVIFRLMAPNATDVKLSTQITNEPQNMIRDDKGLWSITLGPVEPDIYPYHFVVDGMKVADPKNSWVFPNEGFQNSLVEIPAETPQVYTVQNKPHGTLLYRYYFSNELGTRQF